MTRVERAEAKRARRAGRGDGFSGASSGDGGKLWAEKDERAKQRAMRKALREAQAAALRGWSPEKLQELVASGAIKIPEGADLKPLGPVL